MESDHENADPRWHRLYTVAGIAAMAQLVCVLITIVVIAALGLEPTTAEEYYTVFQENRLEGLLRMDFSSLINVALYSVTFFAIYAALKRTNDIYVAFATALVLVGVVLGLSAHSAFSIVHLSDQYETATTVAEQSRLLAAGEAVIASNWWNSTGGVFAGIFLQGGAVLASFIMLQSRLFSKRTAYTGILSNGLDWLHVLIGLVFPSLASVVGPIGGMFYLVWFPLLGLDLLRLGRHARQSTLE